MEIYNALYRFRKRMPNNNNHQILNVNTKQKLLKRQRNTPTTNNVATFIYCDPITKKITKLFRNTGLGFAYKTDSLKHSRKLNLVANFIIASESLCFSLHQMIYCLVFTYTLFISVFSQFTSSQFIVSRSFRSLTTASTTHIYRHLAYSVN